jgi:hypothetical protein
MRARSAAQRRYLRRTIAVTAFYLASVAAASFLIDRGEVSVTTVLLALLPGLAIIGVFWSIGRLMVEESDEFIRMLIVRQSLIATAVALSTASVWGFLEAYGIVQHIDSYWVVVLWFFGLGVGGAVNRIQYGAFGECR